MTRKTIIISLLLLTMATIALAQKATELYIPIGKSPGLSGEYTIEGTIMVIMPPYIVVEAIDGSPFPLYTVEIASNSCPACDDGTLIFLDRSRAKPKPLVNTYGRFEDFKPGAYIEVKFVGNVPTLAEWVKVERGG